MELTQGRSAGGDWRRWLSTRRGTFAIAALSALIAAGVLVYALSHYRQSVNPSANQQEVLVATQLIEQGASGDAIGVGRFYRAETVPVKQVSAGALREPGALHGQIAASDIYPGQQLTSADFVTGGIVSHLAASQRAITVPLEGARGLLGNVHSGDHVDVYGSFPSQNASATAAVRLVAPNVVVLSVAQPGSGGIGAGSNTNAITDVVLEVTPEQAAELALAVDNGKVWLTLRPGNGSATNTDVVTLRSILSRNPSEVELEGKK